MYLSGFGNYHQSEAIAGALPQNQNSPQVCSHGLYAEQLSGSAFTRPRHCNLRTWFYRQVPSVVRQDYKPYQTDFKLEIAAEQSPNPMRWSPMTMPETAVDFIDSLFYIAGNRQVNSFIYHCNRSMNQRYFSNSDGELLFIPYLGRCQLKTEMGCLELAPGQIAVIPRGVFFNVELIDASIAGYLCENKGNPLTLPQLGPIGSNGLANPRHFLYPKAAFESVKSPSKLLCKYLDKLWIADSDYSPLNVVAWHGNYAPYSYDLALFNTINTVSFDHPDPSIFTVLTSESEIPGVANLDFVIFPPRWMVAEETFRPPYFHRNIMSELMGLIVGEYDAKKEGFSPGGISIHNCMTGHGPDKATFDEASRKELKPERYDKTLAFMLETCHPWLVSESALQHANRQLDYTGCWQGLG